MGIKKRYVILPVLMVLFGYMLYSVYVEVRLKTIAEFNTQQMIFAKQATRGIEDFFDHCFHQLTSLSGISNIASFNDQGKNLMQSFHAANSHNIRAVTRVDADGRIIYTVPFNKKAIGADISYQDHVRTIMETHQPVVSDVFMAVQGYKAVAYHVPILEEGTYQGSLAVLIPFDILAKEYLENIKIGDGGYAWMISQKGVELYCPIPGHVGKTVFATSGKFPSAISMAEKMMKGKQGTATYLYDRIRGETIKKITKQAAYYPVRLGNTFWSIVVATPENQVLATIKGFRNKLLIVAALLMATGMIYSYYFIKAWAILREEKRRRQAEEALLKSEEKYRQLADLLPQIVFETDESGNLTFANRMAFDLFGYTRDDFQKGLNALQMLIPRDRDRAMANMLRILEGEELGGTEYTALRKDGSTYPAIIYSTPIISEGKTVGLRGIIADLTQIKQAEEEKMRLGAQLQQAQKMEAIGTLAGGIAHDFNNLLMGIQGRASLMLMDRDSSHPDSEHLRGIEDYVKSAADLTRQLLGFARGGKYEVKPTNLNELVRKSALMFGRTKKEITIHPKYQEQVWTVEVDQGQIEQVLLNLCVNAWQSMPGGGDLYIQTENLMLDDSYVKSFDMEPGEYVKISVTDTGVGMDEATRQRVFEPFFTTKEMGRGTGLGLASAYGIIKSHKGIINVYSDKGEGATFDIYLPATKAEVGGKKSEIGDDIIRGHETVLLVDDEDMIIDVGQKLLGKLGYEVLIAGSGKEAIEIVRKTHSAEEKSPAPGPVPHEPDLVILDMIMPDMGGGETYDRLKEINPEIKVLLSSGYSINGQANEILDRGCNGFIQKPFNMAQLSKKVSEILD